MQWRGAYIDWNATAAWVQAVGSIAAILAAVWIDRGTARRLTRERAAASAEAAKARREAIEHAALVLDGVTAALRNANMSKNTSVTLTEDNWLSLDSARDTLAYYLTQEREEVSPKLVLALARSRQLLTKSINRISDSMPLEHPGPRDRLVEALELRRLDMVKALRSLNLGS